MPQYLITGVAKFIASKVAELLLADGHTVVGVDNLNDAYDVRLKHWRLDQIKHHPNFTFHKLDICDRPALYGLFNSQFSILNSFPPRSSFSSRRRLPSFVSSGSPVTSVACSSWAVAAAKASA